MTKAESALHMIEKEREQNNNNRLFAREINAVYEQHPSDAYAFGIDMFLLGIAKGRRMEKAGYSLALQMETDASAELVSGGTAMDSTAALTKANIYDTIVDARTKLSETHVPTDGRWLLVSPETYALLLKSPEFVKASALGDAVVQTGAVGRVAGFTVFEDTTLGEKVDFIAGHPNWFTRIEEWSEPVAVNDLKGSGTFIGACAVQGRKIYAHKVTKAQTVLVKSHA